MPRNSAINPNSGICGAINILKIANDTKTIKRTPSAKRVNVEKRERNVFIFNMLCHCEERSCTMRRSNLPTIGDCFVGESALLAVTCNFTVQIYIQRPKRLIIFAAWMARLRSFRASGACAQSPCLRQYIPLRPKHAPIIDRV